MKIETNSFIIESDKKIDYIDKILELLENDTKGILEFFNLEKLSKKKKVIIYSNVEKYKEHLLPYVKEYKIWMCGDTYDNNINLLDIDEARSKTVHNDMTFEQFYKGILHELVHACQQEINSNADGVEWFWESLENKFKWTRL